VFSLARGHLDFHLAEASQQRSRPVAVAMTTSRALRFATRQLRMTSVARPRQCQVEFALDHCMDEFPNPIAKASFDRVKPSVEKVDSCLGCRLRLKLRGNVRHGVDGLPARRCGHQLFR
jgi:hypothetical protein